ncbi:hypothetical protein P5V15_001552 [Pogonomyrmex californicus]
MSTHDTEICGFLDIKLTGNKYIARKMKKKPLALSRVWKRTWCSVKKLKSGLGVQVQFDLKLGNVKQNEKGDFVEIPSDAVLYRVHSRTKRFAFCIALARDRKALLSLSANSETETQRWMANIRYLLKPKKYCFAEKSYQISMIDNTHSKVAGITGLYGDLIANEMGIFIRNIHTGDVAETFQWKEFSQFHLMTAGRPEDVKRICVMHTSKEFRCGIGEFHIFCLDANKLLQDLVTQGRGPKHRRRFLHSNSENLEMMQRDEIAIDNLPLQLKSDATFCISNADANCARTSISTKAVENIYQPEPNEKLDSYSHEESNISVASGIYEEIRDDVHSFEPKTSLTCDNINKIPCNFEMEAPTLPPRWKQWPEHIEKDRMNTRQSHLEILNHFETRLQNIVHTQETSFTDHSNYVPMSPQLRDLDMSETDVLKNSKENDYVIMR